MSLSSSDVYNKNLIAEPNFTQVPNVIFDHWMNVLDHCTSIVLLFLCRKTFGWHKKKDCLSLSKIEDGTNMSRNRVIKSLKTLEDYGLIIKQQHKNVLGDQDPNTYELIIHGGVVHDVNYVVHEENHPGSARNELGVVHGVNTQKKDIQKKNNTSKEDIASNASLRSFDITFSFESGKFEGITHEDISKWKELYPTVDVQLELKQIVEWILGNTAKSKSKKKWRQFINNWFRTNNDKNINKQAYQANKGIGTQSHEDISKNIQFCHECNKYLESRTYVINILSECVELTPKANGTPFFLKFSENGFRDQLKNALLKHGFNRKK